MSAIIKEKATVNFLVMIALPFLSACAHWPSDKRQEIPATVSVSQTYVPTDASFMITAAEEYLQGIHMGQLALDRSHSEKVKALANTIGKERTESLKELKKIAARKFILIPVELPFEKVLTSKNFHGITGWEFDKIYCNMVETEQRQTILNFEKNVQDVKDDEIRRWAFARLPGLKSQLELAIECRKQTEKMSY